VHAAIVNEARDIELQAHAAATPEDTGALLDRLEFYAEPGEFTVDAAVSPRRVLASEAQNRPTGLKRNAWLARPMRVGAMVGDEASVPPEDRAGPHQ
jgi:hypothetical protein